MESFACSVSGRATETGELYGTCVAGANGRGLERSPPAIGGECMASQDVEDFLARFSEPTSELAHELIDVIRAAAPDASIGVRAGWGCVSFTSPRVGYFAGAFVEEGKVRVGFEFGVLLDDSARQLTGTGTQLRYLPMPQGRPIPADYLKRLVEQANDLPGAIAVRRMMVRERGG